MIPLICPKCGSNELRLHGTIYRLDATPRWLLFGPMVTHRKIAGHDCSCAKCFYAFSVVDGRHRDAPVQTMHDAVGVNRVRDKLAAEKQEREKDERKASPGYDADVAGDPRDRVR